MKCGPRWGERCGHQSAIPCMYPALRVWADGQPGNQGRPHPSHHTIRMAGVGWVGPICGGGNAHGLHPGYPGRSPRTPILGTTTDIRFCLICVNSNTSRLPTYLPAPLIKAIKRRRFERQRLNVSARTSANANIAPRNETVSR